MAFTEFYCNYSTGANINAGDLTANGVVTSTNGDWGNAAANRFTAASGTPFSGVSVGDFASVYLDGATVAVYIGRVTAVNAGGASLDISSTAKSGTAPTTGATGRSCTTGGAWKGPNAASGFPFGFITNAQTNVAGDTPRVNFKNNAQYDITAAMTHANAGPVQFEGYTSTAGDGGRATIDGGTSGASYDLLTISGGFATFKNFIMQNNGATGSQLALYLFNVGTYLVERCVFTSLRGWGTFVNTGLIIYRECEAYGCNQSNTSNLGGFGTGQATTYERCISHDNAGNNSMGYAVSGAGFATFIDCIADTNGADGFNVNGTFSQLTMKNCDSYNNTRDGVRLANTSAACHVIENSNLIKNGGYGINGSGAGGRIGAVTNCGFGAGTQANTSGTTTGLKGMVESGSITYASNVTPWVDPANGDFRIILAAAQGAGRGTFTQTAASYAGTIAYPDIGSAQSADPTTAAVAGANMSGGFQN